MKRTIKTVKDDELDQMMEEWRLDATVDSTELGIASLKIPELHSKYLKIYLL